MDLDHARRVLSGRRLHAMLDGAIYGAGCALIFCCWCVLYVLWIHK